MVFRPNAPCIGYAWSAFMMSVTWVSHSAVTAKSVRVQRNLAKKPHRRHTQFCIAPILHAEVHTALPLYNGTAPIFPHNCSFPLEGLFWIPAWYIVLWVCLTKTVHFGSDVFCTDHSSVNPIGLMLFIGYKAFSGPDTHQSAHYCESLEPI